MRNNQRTPMIFLDQATCHSSAETRRTFAKYNIRLNFIPKRMTGLLQPADVTWFSSMKNEYRRLWTQWMMTSDHSYTASGNLRSPGYARVIIS